MSCYSRQKAKFFKNVKQRFDKGANKRSWKVGIKEYVGIVADPEKYSSGGKSTDRGHSLYKFAKFKEISFKYAQIL
jgi:hypothetical protein